MIQVKVKPQSPKAVKPHCCLCTTGAVVCLTWGRYRHNQVLCLSVIPQRADRGCSETTVVHEHRAGHTNQELKDVQHDNINYSVYFNIQYYCYAKLW